jgi:diketogulonate reductase-like aldo/keto reductase
MHSTKRVRLNNGVEMPILGLGVWKMEDGPETERAVSYAIEHGYRLIDTAKLYGNEASVGRAVRGCGIAREEIFVTTKLWPTDFLDPEKAFHASLERLGLEYVDLYLIHWPIPLMPRRIWQRLEKLYDEKRVRAIGISNYGVGEIETTLSYARIRPAVNQVPFSPFDFPRDLMDYCEAQHIALEAYSPLTRAERLGDRVLGKIAKKYGKTPAQLMIRWCIEHGVIVIPKASRPEHIRENAAVFDFEIAAEDMSILDELSR